MVDELFGGVFGWILDLLLWVGIARLFYFRPSITKQGGALLAVSGWRTHLFTLGAVSRRILVDPSIQAVRIHGRRFWLFPYSRRIPFDRVVAVRYGYKDMSPGAMMPWGAYREKDLFTVGLRLHNGEELTLFRFFGEGEFVNNTFFPDWMYWEDHVMTQWVRGEQESESRAYAGLLTALLNVPMENI